MLIHLINLDRAEERLKEFHKLNEGILQHIVRFPAADGHTVNVAELLKNETITPIILERYTAGHLGTALSHLSLWRQAVEREQIITVCEDDAIFNHDFVHQAEIIISELGDDWDIILWGWNFDSILSIDLLPDIFGSIFCSQDALRKHITKIIRSSYAAHPKRLHQVFGTISYSVSPKGARSLIEFCFPLREMMVLIPRVSSSDGDQSPIIVPNVGIDVAMCAAYPRLQAFVSFPPLVVTKNEMRGSASDEEALVKSPVRTR